MIETSELDIKLQEAFEKCKVRVEDRTDLQIFLNLLLAKSPITKPHGEHSIRVGLKGVEIAKFLGLDPRALLFAGLTHDLGKCQVPLEILGKTDDWTEADAELIQSHVIDGYRMLRGRFDFTADTMVLHHTFQEKGYPQNLPQHLHPYSEKTRTVILKNGRILALSDVYDALHRENSKYVEGRRLTDVEIMRQMYILNPDKEELVRDLYQEKIFV